MSSCALLTGGEILADNPYVPQKGDDILTRAEAFIDAAEWLAEGNTLKLSGNLPTPCHQLRIFGLLEEKTLEFEVYSLVDPETICATVLAPFDAQLTVIELPEKVKTITVNGKIVFSR